jgi:cyclophilin family peptidyl-prolyl cis-trans isomerase
MTIARSTGKRNFRLPCVGLLTALLLFSAVPSPVRGASSNTTTPSTSKIGHTMKQVLLKTTQGDIVIALDEEKAPLTVANFLAYVKDGFYNGTIFHRVIPGFMIQGGGMTADMEQKANGEPIKNEADNGLKNLRGTLAMARTQVVDSATSQFFINLVDNPYLDHQDPSPQGYGYAVFGKVTEGMETVDAIAGVATGNSGMHQNVPVEPVIIEQASVLP